MCKYEELNKIIWRITNQNLKYLQGFRNFFEELNLGGWIRLRELFEFIECEYDKWDTMRSSLRL